MVQILATVPLGAIERELAKLSPGCQPHSMTCAEVIRTLGVAGIASLAGVSRAVVLESAGPESCAVSDLIEPNPYGHLTGANRPCRPCGPCSSVGYGPSLGRGPGALVNLAGGPGVDPGYTIDTEGYPVDFEGARMGVEAVTDYGASYTPSSPQGYATGVAADSSPRLIRSRRNPDGSPTLVGSSESAVPLETMTPAERAAAIQSMGPAAATGWPSAVPFRSDAWNYSEGWYILQQHDTFSGLAATYLGAPWRWMEIWTLQPYRYTLAPDPSSVKPDRPIVPVGSRVIMPPEAVETAKELARSGAPSAPAIGGPGGSPKGAGKPWTLGTKLAIGAGVVAVVGVGAAVLTK